MPTLLRIGRHRFFFWSNEAGEPAHIHVESGDEYAKFWIRPVRVADNDGYNRRELNRLALVEQHEDLFQERWNDYFGSDNARPGE